MWVRLRLCDLQYLWKIKRTCDFTATATSGKWDGGKLQVLLVSGESIQLLSIEAIGVYEDRYKLYGVMNHASGLFLGKATETLHGGQRYIKDLQTPEQLMRFLPPCSRGQSKE